VLRSRTTTGVFPTSILQIQGDPTLWGLADTVAEDPHWREPVAIKVVAPVRGTLVLSPARAGSFSLVGPDDRDGWMPAVEPVFAHLYIPTVQGLTTASPGWYYLASGTDLEDLRHKIMAAMREGSFLTVPVEAVGGGIVVLNGAQLPFAVLGRGE
jgi:hypothetical protein